MLIVFDLDGTLIDSSKDLAISMNATRECFGMAPLDPALIYSYVGNGVPMLVKRALGPDAPEPLVCEGLQFFLQFYGAHALKNTQPYPGIRQMLAGLAGGGHKLGVLTNKPLRISFDILGALGMQERFLQVYGGDSFPNKKPDPIGIHKLLEDAGMNANEAWMVGDSGVDVRTARNAGVSSCGVRWGFQPESFVLDPPDVMIETPGELLELVAAEGAGQI